jgi:uncharacterized protein YuzE
VWLVPEGTKVADTAEVAPGIMLAYDASGKVIGIGVLDMRSRTARALPLIARSSRESVIKPSAR